MTLVRNILLIGVLMTLLFSCSSYDTSTLSVVSPLPAGVVSGDGGMIFTFSRGVVRQDSLNQWSVAPYIEFTPPIAGKFVWQDTTRLVFSADGPLAGDMQFKGVLNTSLLTSLAGAKSFGGPTEFHFRTESFTLKQAELFYDRIGEKRLVGIRANLDFTYAVNPQDLAAHIRVTIDKAPQQILRVTSTDKSRTIALEIGTVTQLDKSREIAIDFDGQLVSPETNTRITMEKPFLVTLPPLAEMQIYGHEVGFDGVTAWIRVRTSQECDQAAVKASVELNPVREFTVQNDGRGFTLRGRFDPGTAFRLVIKKGLESILGGKTQNEYSADVVIGNIAPSFKFASTSGLYMMLSGERSIDLATINMPKLFVRVSQVFQNNLVYFLDQGRYYDYSYGDYDDEEGGGGNSWQRKYRYYVGNYGRQLRADTISLQAPTNQEVTTAFDLKPYLKNGYKGFYVVEIANLTEQWRSSSKLISISDLGLIVKRCGDEILVFATSIATTEPVSGVLVSLISTNNQTMAAGKTDGQGVARFPNARSLQKDFTLKLVTAELGDDFNFIHLADYRVETSRYDVAGKRSNEGVYDAMLYGDRTIYRPGETVYISGIVRSLRDPLPAHMPVRLRITSPSGTMVSEQLFTLNDEGSFETTYKSSTTGLSGEYRADLYTGTNLFLATYKVSIEDFVPDRLRINLTASQETARPGETVRYDFQAFNFFGPPAAGRNWEFEGSYDVQPFVSKTYPDFRFFDDGTKPFTPNPDVQTGKTDDQGKASVSLALPNELASTGILRARGRVAVFDESGRPVYQAHQLTVFPKSYFIGVANRGAYYIAPNVPQKMKIVGVDQHDQPVNGLALKVETIRREWHSVLRQHEQTKTLRYVSERIDVVERTDRVVMGSEPVEYSYLATRSGDYVVRVSKDGDSGFTQFSFYSYSWGTSDITSFEINPEARVEMVFDKKVYAPGEKAKILFQTPFSGKMLVTIEGDRVLTYRYLDVVNNAATLDLPVEESYLPNVYVSAVLFRKINDANIPLLAGHGFAPLMVERPSNKLDVSISAPDKIRPKTQQKITVQAGHEKNVYLTFAAVDEGICQVKNYRTPDPYGYFYARKALETETYDFFKHLIPERGSRQKSSAGGSDADLAKRSNPLAVTRFKPVSLWSGIVKTNGNGEAVITLDVPEFNGELRLMVFAYKGNRFGSAQQAMKVADPVIITPALPRFVAPGDSVMMPITAFNTTAKPTSLTFEIATSGGVRCTPSSVSLDLGANQEKYVAVSLRATDQIGKATVTVKATAFGENLETSIDLPVRPVAPFVAENIRGFVDGNGSVQHAVSDAYLPYGRKAYLSISPYPVSNFAKELKDLMGYPHGCLEQTVSKAFPQIYLRDIAAVLAPGSLTGGSPTYFVNEAITKIGSMQMFDGAFQYWPGGGESDAWATVYATHFLLEARKAGYAVNEAMIKSALNAVGTIARTKKTYDYTSQDNQRIVVRRIADKSGVYALFVLALAGTPDKSLMDFYRIEKGLLTSDTKYLLGGAYAFAGDRRAFSEVIPSEFSLEEPRGYCWYFDSPVRANALILNVLLDTDLNNAAIPRYMEYLSRTYQANRWYSTQDDAFTLLAFGKAARMASSTHVIGTVSAGEMKFNYGGGNQKFDFDPFGKTVALATKGEGRVYYSLVTEGIRTDGAVKIEDRNLQIRRDYLDRSGNSVNIQDLRQNALVVVRLTLTSSVERLPYVAITDLLPAGFEIDNPRVTAAGNYPFAKNAATPQYMDIRDDRINFYTSFNSGARQQVFYYIVRAVSAGAFVAPPVVAEAMYDGAYYSASGAGKVRIVR